VRQHQRIFFLVRNKENDKKVLNLEKKSEKKRLKEKKIKRKKIVQDKG